MDVLHQLKTKTPHVLRIFMRFDINFLKNALEFNHRVTYRNELSNSALSRILVIDFCTYCSDKLSVESILISRALIVILPADPIDPG